MASLDTKAPPVVFVSGGSVHSAASKALCEGICQQSSCAPTIHECCYRDVGSNYHVPNSSTMSDQFSYVHEALGLFSPEAGLDEATATNLLYYQLSVPVWRAGFVNELTAMLSSDTTDWISVVDNNKFCIGEFETPDEARAYVIKLLAPFVPGLSDGS